MIRQAHSQAREIIVATAIKDVVAELRLVEFADYVAFIRMERFANLADLVATAAELYFLPGVLTFGHGGDIELGWSGDGHVVLDMQLKPDGVTVYFRLTLTALHAAVEVDYIAFSDSQGDAEANTAFLERALGAARIRKTRSFTEMRGFEGSLPLPLPPPR